MRRLLSPLRRGGAVLLLLGVVVALCLGSGPARAGDGSGPPPGTPSPTPPVGPAHAGTGEQLYLYSCATCHGQRGEGSQRGPSLVGVGEATVDFYLRTGRMPLPWESVQTQAQRGTPKFDDAQIRAIDGYVTSFGPGGPPIPDVQPGDLSEGRDLYLENCASCHAPSGVGYAQTGGRVAPSLLLDDPTEIAEAVRVGPTMMPRFTDSVLDKDQLDAVVSYVTELQKRSVGGQGGAQIGRIGAAVEGPLAFGVVAFLLILLRLLGRRSAEKEAS